MLYINTCVLQDYISDLANCVQKEDNEEFALECVGILGNLTIPDLDYELLLKEYNLVPWIKTKLQPGQIELNISFYRHGFVVC